MALLQEIKVPLLAVNDTTLTVVECSFPNGSAVKKGELLMVFETSKTTYEVVAEKDGYVQYLCETGKDYEVNELVANIFDEPVAVQTGPVQVTTAAAMVAPKAAAVFNGHTLFSNAAETMIAEKAVDKTRFAGRDFVSKEDVEALLGIATPKLTTLSHQPAASVTKAAAASAQKPALPVDHTKVIVEKLSSGKKREIEYLSAVQSDGLTSTINVSVETGGLFTQLNTSLQYLKNALLPLIVYETARLLKKYPLLNAYFTGDSVAVYKEVHPGFAIDIDKGLKVLKIPAAGQKTIAEIESAIMDLSGKYLDDKLDITDLTEITFTITDLSAEGVSFFRPLVNMMNSAILGVAAIDDPLQRCTLSVTFDHRVTEGRYVAKFLGELKSRLESYRPPASYRAHEISCVKCMTSLAEDITDTGFVSCILPNGTQGYICQRCLQGF